MTWASPRSALQMMGKKKLAELTNEAGQQELLGTLLESTGDGIKEAFTTPFAFGIDLKFYADGIIVPSGYALSLTSDERVVVTFATAPDTGVVLTGSSTDAVNVVNLNAAFLRAQGDVRGMVDAALYETPADDATDVHPDAVGWASDLAWYYLASSPRRPRLLEAYPEYEKRYFSIYDGPDSTLKRVQKGTRSLRGVFPYRGSLPPFTQPTPDSSVQPVEFSSVPRVYGGGRGVF